MIMLCKSLDLPKTKKEEGTRNDNKGYLYVSKNYVRYKTMNIIVNQKGTPKDLVRKFKKAPYIS